MTRRSSLCSFALGLALLEVSGCGGGGSGSGRGDLAAAAGGGGSGGATDAAAPAEATGGRGTGTAGAGGAAAPDGGRDEGGESGAAGDASAGGPGAGGALVDGGAEAGSRADGGVVDGGPDPSCDGPGPRFATEAVSHAFGGGQNFGQAEFPAPVLGPPRGAGACQGSTDVVSLGNGGTVVLGFGGNAIVDGPGADFIVFENAFGTGCDATSTFAELGTVSVSDDGTTWHDFPCTASEPPYGACSGARVVYANPDSNAIDPLDPAVAGGDAYDLSVLGLERARFVKITDRADLTGPAGVYDLDAVAIVHALCP